MTIIKKARLVAGLFGMAELTRLELATSHVTGGRSNQLSYNSMRTVILPEIGLGARIFLGKKASKSGPNQAAFHCAPKRWV